MLNKILFTLIFFSTFLLAQDMNKTITDTVSNKKMLIGLVNREAFKDTTFSSWFNANYDKYDIDKDELTEINADLSKIEIKIIMGSWCSDSREQVPGVLKILDFLKIPESHYQIICVDRSKSDGGNLTKDLDIQKIPTIIVIKDGYEMGRIIETPKETLETDLVELINKVI